MQKTVLFLLCFLPSVASAQSVSLAEVIRETLANSPDISISNLSIDIARAGQQSIEGALDPNVFMLISHSDETIPTANPFAANQTQFSQLSGSITKPLEDGSTLTGSLDYSRIKFIYPDSVPAIFQSTINPVYQSQIDLTYRYPLLRGRGNPAYREQMAASKQDEQAAFWRVEILKEQLAEQAISLYFQLAADGLALELAEEAVQRTNRLLKYQRQREQFGLIERADRLQAEALLATRRMELNIAQARTRQGRTSLNRLMLRAANAPLTPDLDNTISAPDQGIELSLNSLLEEAERIRPTFRVIDATLAASRARLTAARDQHESQIDLIGQIGSRALDGSALNTAGNSFTLKDRFVSLSVELSDTITGNATQAVIRQAELSRQQAVLERIQAQESVKSRLADALTVLSSTQKTVVSAKKRAGAEQQKFSAEMKRYREGRSDTATLIQFEGDLRTSQLQAAMQQVSLKLAIHQLALARGTLLSHLRVFQVQRSQVQSLQTKEGRITE